MSEQNIGSISKSKNVSLFLPDYLVPLDFDIFQTSLTLTAIPEMHDRYIVATGLYLHSLGETVEILTKDNEIIVSKLIPVVWN